VKLAPEPVAAVVVRDEGVGTVADRKGPPLGVGERRHENDPRGRIGGAHVADRVEVEPAFGAGSHQNDVGVPERRRSDGIAHRLGAPGDADVRMAVDDGANFLSHLGVGLDDENREAGAVRCLRTGDGPFTSQAGAVVARLYSDAGPGCRQ